MLSIKEIFCVRASEDEQRKSVLLSAQAFDQAAEQLPKGASEYAKRTAGTLFHAGESMTTSTSNTNKGVGIPTQREINMAVRTAYIDWIGDQSHKRFERYGY